MITRPGLSPTVQAAPASTHLYRPEIDGLRALAVLAVILNHIDRRWLPSGHLGVDVFFVISGFVITLSLGRQQAGPLAAGPLLAAFYARRIKRLLPALLAALLLGGLLTRLFHPQALVPLRTALAALFGFSNLYLLRQSTDYFTPAAERNPFTHTWSLGVEEQFYLVYPWLLLLCGYGRHRHGRRRLLWLVGAASVASLLAFTLLTPVQRSLAYFLMPTRFWELGAGCLLAAALAGRETKAIRPPAWLEAIPGWLPLGLLLLSLLLPSALALPATLLAVASTTLLIAVLRPHTPCQRLFSCRLLVGLGLLSYSLYLWHWIVLAISRWTIGIHLWTLPLQLAAMLLLAWASYRWLEVPLRRARWSARPGGTLLIGLGLSAAAAGVLQLLQMPAAARLYRGDADAVLQLARLGQSGPGSVAAGSSWSPQRCVIGGGAPGFSRDGWSVCTLPPQAHPNGRSVLVLGNSFAVAQLEGFTAFTRRGYAVRLVASWGCPPGASLVTRNAWSQACIAYHRRVVPRLLESLREGDRVLLVYDLSPFADRVAGAALEGYDDRPGDLLHNGRPTALPQRLAALHGDLDGLAADLQRRGIRLGIQTMGPLTRALPDPSQCVRLFAALPPLQTCRYLPASLHRQARRSLQAMLADLQHRHPGLLILDPLPSLCADGFCSYLDERGRLLYRDTAHLSDRGARGLDAELSRLVAAD